MNLSIVVGNPRPRSRTLLIAEVVADRIASARDARIERTVDLADHALDLFKWPHEGLSELTVAVAASDIVVFASPTYKSAYTGLMKAFLDRYPTDGLAGVTAVPVMTGGSSAHALAVDTALRPVLVDLGASLPTRGLYFVMSQMPELESIVDRWAAQNLVAPALVGPLVRGANA